MKPTEEILTADEAADFSERLIRLGSSDPKHPFRYPVLSTVCEKRPESRMLVLRKVTAEPFSLLMYTDARTEKVRAIETNPSTAALFWHPKLSLQLRADTRAEIIRSGSFWEEAWQNVDGERRAEYNTENAPGTVIGPAQRRPELRSVFTDASFALIRLEVLAAEVLMLRRSGHLRASWTYEGGKRTRAQCLVP